MNTPRGQSLADADRDVRQYLIRIAAALGDTLGDDLAGLYVHGSLAAGFYHRDRSDLDLIAVSARMLEPEERERIARTLVNLSDARPTRGDIDVYLIAQSSARSHEHPMPYEVHYSASLHERIRRGRMDYSGQPASADLAARIVELLERGATLVGPPAQSMFAPVPWHAFIGSLESRLRSSESMAAGNPAWAVLEACRVLYGTTSKHMRGLSKDEAGVWAMENAPEQFRSIVNDALQIYRGTKGEDDVVFAQREVAEFREYVRERSQSAFRRASDTGEEE